MERSAREKDISFSKVTALTFAFTAISWCLLAQAPTPPPRITPGHRTFELLARFKTAVNKGQAIVAKRGMFIGVKDRDPDSEIIYQPIILCDDLTIRFDASGLSEWTPVRGFCPAYRVTIAPENVDLVFTTVVSPLIRDNGCDDPNMLLRVRETYANPPPQMNPMSPSPRALFETCYSRERRTCVRYFENLDRIQQWGGSLKELEKQNICGMTLGRDGGRQVWYLKCRY